MPSLLSSMTFAELLSLALKKYALMSTHGERTKLAIIPRITNPIIQEVIGKYKDKLVPLRRISFTKAGSWPISVELSQAWHILFQSGIYRYPDASDSTAIAINLHEDTAQVVLEKLRQLNQQELEDFTNFAEELGRRLEAAVAP